MSNTNGLLRQHCAVAGSTEQVPWARGKWGRSSRPPGCDRLGGCMAAAGHASSLRQHHGLHSTYSPVPQTQPAKTSCQIARARQRCLVVLIEHTVAPDHCPIVSHPSSLWRLIVLGSVFSFDAQSIDYSTHLVSTSGNNDNRVT